MRTFTAVVNPAAGSHRRRAKARLSQLVGHLRDAGSIVAVELSHDPAQGAELAKAAVERGDVVLAVGGDGTAGGLAAMVADAGGVLGIVPAGRGNDFARQLSLPRDPASLARVLLTAQPQPVDVIDVDGDVVIGSVYTGIDAVANQYFNRVRLLGGAAYHYAAGRALLSWRPARYRITVDGAVHEARGYTVVAANSGFYGNGRRPAPDARVDDGVLDVVVLRDVSKRAFTSIAMRELYTGAHVNRPEVEILKGREIHIDADRGLPYGGDGELLGTLPVTIRVRPGALRVLASDGSAHPG
ncbi:diacylglycerol/lipid kinase family protein [Phytoactinopolyspora limicola]|uniref:diacylglycerol/lipid kinase family protein n=1 Tax=Phytoactinopolyspora limicola TaxID=2715536 RepID=UPI00140CE82D|nr:diacylglycerol kinase family protein [Phytoactinopolyspora limicola]